MIDTKTNVYILIVFNIMIKSITWEIIAWQKNPAST